MLIVTGAVLIASSLWVGASWIDLTSTDQTCESVFRPTGWLGSTAPAGCHNVMTLRAVLTGSMLVLALVFIAKALRRRAISRRWVTAGVVAIVGSAVVLVINEAVRSAGGL